MKGAHSHDEQKHDDGHENDGHVHVHTGINIG